MSIDNDWPPPAHDPRQRVVVAEAGEWQIRGFAHDDPKFDYFARRGFLHLQLWHPRARISVLTPSRLTGGLFEVYPISGWKLPVLKPALLRALVLQHHGVEIPSRRQVALFVEWYVRAEERRLAAACAALGQGVVQKGISAESAAPPPVRRRTRTREGPVQVNGARTVSTVGVTPTTSAAGTQASPSRNSTQVPRSGAQVFVAARV